MNDLEKYLNAICGEKKENACTSVVNSHKIIARTPSHWIPMPLKSVVRQYVF